jgi:hypothetical protein
MAGVIRAGEQEQVPLTRELKRLQGDLSWRTAALRSRREHIARTRADPYRFVTVREPLVGIFTKSPKGDLTVKTTKSNRMTRDEVKLLLKDFETALKKAPAEALAIPFDGVAIDPLEVPFIEAVMTVPHPSGEPGVETYMFFPPSLIPRNIESLRGALVAIERAVERTMATLDEEDRVDVPRNEATIREIQAEIPRVEAQLAESRRRGDELQRQMNARVDELRALKKEAAKKGAPAPKGKKGKKSGQGGEHKAFPYSRPGLTRAEKAAERAKHYRDTVRAARFGEVKFTRLHEGDDVVEGERVKKQYEKSNPEKKLRSYKGDVLEWTEVKPAPLKAVVDARGPAVRAKKVTLPKKGSVRKPYVGKKMKESFMEAVKGRGEKEQRNLFNKAKRLYKEGESSWEDITTRVLG